MTAPYRPDQGVLVTPLARPAAPHSFKWAPVSAVIPTIPPRRSMYYRALRSVQHQEVVPEFICVATDLDKRGSAATRNEALDRVTTPWSAFLDDDDEWLPNHLDVLWNAARQTEYDVYYTGCEVVLADGTRLPHENHAEEWGRFGRDFSPEILRQRSCLPVTSMVRTELAKQARFGPPDGVETPYDDWGFYLRMLDLGARFLHIPERTWLWHHHGANTSGQPDRW